MKKLSPGRVSQKVGVVAVYESGIQDIIDLLRAKPNTVVTVEHDGAEFDSIDDLREHRGEFLRTLKIVARLDSRGIGNWGSLSIEFVDSGVWLSADNSFELECRRICELLSARRRWMGRVPDQLWYMLGGALWVVTIAMPSVLTRWFAISGFIALVMYAVFVAAALYVGSDQLKIRRNVLSLKKEHEHQNWWRRNQDALVQQIIGAVVGAVVGGVIGYLVGSGQATRPIFPEAQPSVPSSQPATNSSPEGK